jgi:thiamine pyrophosphokinase
MRALLVCAAAVAGSSELLTVLSGEADLVIAVDGGGSLCLEAGVAPNLLLGDFDSLPLADLDRLRDSGVEILRFPAEKDSSDLELAVAEARRRGAESVVVTAASAGRLDHTLAVLGVLAASADLQSRLADPELDVWTLAPAGRDSIMLSGMGATISLLAFGTPAVVTAEGTVWALQDVTLPSGSSLGLSNRIGPSGRARISVASGVVLVFAPQVAGTVRAQAT